LLRAERANVRLEIAGAGPDHRAISEEVQALGMAARVTFLGWQKDLAPLLARWDIFVLPSLEESFGIAALEAMAAGCVVIATAVGGVPELIEHGRTGWLVPAGDSNALADRIQFVVANPELRRATEIAARTRAREYFSADRMVAQIAEVYDEILSSRR
jgi:glycosyltransferase involved in cell wall biosynthesis